MERRLLAKCGLSSFCKALWGHQAPLSHHDVDDARVYTAGVTQAADVTYDNIRHAVQSRKAWIKENVSFACTRQPSEPESNLMATRFRCLICALMLGRVNIKTSDVHSYIRANPRRRSVIIFMLKSPHFVHVLLIRQR
eukprot:scaffold77640_cov35-Prasinocladus_malaysianus.AAC.5